ncbi:MAG TPA: MGMT family protein [Thermoplasmata archaeon]|nr:MGMT family protein [Thermoplasmata archaeon]
MPIGRTADSDPAGTLWGSAVLLHRMRRTSRALRTGSGGRLASLRRVIRAIPRGKVATYGQVAALAGVPGAARLTVRALYSAPDLPWQRVVAAGGRIALTGTEAQEQRLRLRIEGVTFEGGRVRMDRHAWTPMRRGSGRPRESSSPWTQDSDEPRRGRLSPGLTLPFDPVGPRGRRRPSRASGTGPT